MTAEKLIYTFYLTNPNSGQNQKIRLCPLVTINNLILVLEFQ